MYEMQFCPSGLISSHLVVSEQLVSVPNSVRFCCTGSHVQAKIELFVNYLAIIGTRTVAPCNNIFENVRVCYKDTDVPLINLNHTHGSYMDGIAVLFVCRHSATDIDPYFSP
jgi:hypothetical protein